jgi:opacity protein-like surface antigen
MGFGARGMGMGNAMTSVRSGEIGSHYNPAAPAFSQGRYGMATFGILSLDRSLNYLSYTQPLPPMAGLSVGLINAGVSEIDGRDRDGLHTETYSTYENQVYLSFSNRVAEPFSIGVTIKLYHSKVFDDVTSTTVGFDVGALYAITEELSAAVAAQDLGSKYKWNTKEVYDVGNETEDKFPSLIRLGVSYLFAGRAGVVSVDGEFSSESTFLLKSGIEYTVTENVALRAGFDRLDPGDTATGVKPSAGFTVTGEFSDLKPSLSYAFVSESFAPNAYHILTLSVLF